MKLTEQIGAIPLFEGLPAAQVAELAGIVHEQSFSKGEAIFADGDEARGFFVVTSGRVKIFKLSPDGKEQILHMFGAGEPFGEVAVFAGRRMPANAQAMEKSTALFFPRAALLEVIRRNPDLALGMLAVLSLRLRRFANLIEDLSLKEVPSRLAAYLLYLSSHAAGSQNLELDVTKTELASLLGTIPETLSRVLGKMSRQELIRSDGRRIHILDRQGLADLADAETRLSELPADLNLKI
jgi:CRP/FNR family transcriptional regulator